MKKLMLLFASLLIAFVSIGCDFGLSAEEDPVVPGYTYPTTACTPTSGGDFTVTNNTSWGIPAVFISSSSAESWGPNQLDCVIQSSDSYSWNVGVGTWDFLAIDDTSPYYCYAVLNFDFVSGYVYTWTLDTSYRVTCPTWVPGKGYVK